MGEAIYVLNELMCNTTLQKLVTVLIYRLFHYEIFFRWNSSILGIESETVSFSPMMQVTDKLGRTIFLLNLFKKKGIIFILGYSIHVKRLISF